MSMDQPSTPVDGAELEDVIRRFEIAWQGPARPDIDAFILADRSANARLLVELVHIDLEFRLRAGEATRVEHYLGRYPALASDRQTMLELIAAEYEFRRRAEPGLVLSEHLRRFPQYGGELRDYIARSTIDGRYTPLKPVEPGVEVAPVVEGYEVLALIGRGGMGVVYKAHQRSLNRPVALKFLPAECAQDPAWLNRFRREAVTASALNHPHICTIYDTGECAGRPFLSMEFVEGRTLAELIGARPAIEEVVRLIRQAARALSAAHAAGVVHRDIKPQNLMVRADGILKVLDFGLARRIPGVGSSSNYESDYGARVGTPMYMSPEQARGEPVGTASDIFSLGVVMYELLTGQHPFLAPGDGGYALLFADRAPLSTPSLNPEVPKPLDALVRLMLAGDSARRPTAAEVDATFAELATTGPAGPRQRPPRVSRALTVGRDGELAALRAGFEAAAAGHGSVHCVAGEPGLGKTTLVESFLDELAAGDRAWRLAHGRCSERLAGTEAYLPFLEALDDLLQGDGGSSIAHMLKLLAPTWYVQLVPRAADDPSLAGVSAAMKDATQERRKRELSAFLHEVSRQFPLVLFLDDVHWADPSSVDLLAYLGGKCADLGVMLILTYRPSELLGNEHPFGPIKLDLQGRGVCREIVLPVLTRRDFDHYLTLAYAGHAFPGDFVAVLHARTEGSPLFMVDLLRYLRDRGVIVQADGRWALVRDVPDLQHDLPESVRGMVQRKVDQLSRPDRHLLMAASVQGPEFDAAVVARVLGREAAEVEERLEVLDRVHFMVRLIREQTFPDRTLTLRYGFVHALYQNALYAALQPTRKAAWSAAAARALVGHYGEKSTGLAAELAMLFEAARDAEQAADHYLVAAENAIRVFAHHEAVALARRGLAQLELLPDTQDRARRELRLLMTLGMQLQVVEGYASPEAERTYDRARMLCDPIAEESPSLFLVLWGLWMLYEVRSDLKRSQELAERLLSLARRSQDRSQLLQAHMALAVTTFSLGDFVATREHTEQGIALYDPMQHAGHAHLYGQDPKSGCLAFGAVALWALGYPDQARERSRQAIALAKELGHPTSRALALYFAAMLHHYCRDVAAVEEHTEATTAIATEHRLSLWLANGLVMGGWALAERGDFAGGIAMLRRGLTDWAATGAETHRTYFLGLLAEALGRAGQFEEALGVLADALRLTAQTGTVFHWAELHRLRGELLQAREWTEDSAREAEASFHKAISIARRQQARSLELRATTSLARLYQKLDRRSEGRPMLLDCYSGFTQGFESRDLREAKSLLEELS
jgi:predicted ATPase